MQASTILLHDYTRHCTRGNACQYKKHTDICLSFNTPATKSYLSSRRSLFFSTYVFEWFLKLSELVEALLHDTGSPLVHSVILVGGVAQYALNRLCMMCFN